MHSAEQPVISNIDMKVLERFLSAKTLKDALVTLDSFGEASIEFSFLRCLAFDRFPDEIDAAHLEQKDNALAHLRSQNSKLADQMERRRLLCEVVSSSGELDVSKWTRFLSLCKFSPLHSKISTTISKPSDEQAGTEETDQAIAEAPSIMTYNTLIPDILAAEMTPSEASNSARSIAALELAVSKALQHEDISQRQQVLRQISSYKVKGAMELAVSVWQSQWGMDEQPSFYGQAQDFLGQLRFFHTMPTSVLEEYACFHPPIKKTLSYYRHIFSELISTNEIDGPNTSSSDILSLYSDCFDALSTRWEQCPAVVKHEVMSMYLLAMRDEYLRLLCVPRSEQEEEVDKEGEERKEREDIITT
ncbi:hypothetical protein ADUPG1_000602, partial [Aduncisulcus paluster]